MCPLAEVIATGIPQETEIFLHHKEGHRLPVAVRINPVYDKDGAIIGGVELFSDISGHENTRLKIEELEKLALLDPLTGLANRRFVEMEMENRLREQDRYGWTFGLLLMDLDGFKQVNDTFGHLTGDAILKTVSKTIANNARPFDLFGRWGGDEFTGLLKNVDAKMVYDVGRRLRLLIKETYVVVGDKEVFVTVSIGGTLARPDDNKESLLDRADKLMYKSKSSGHNRFTMDMFD
jgi:diguanylate cyclase (GGDEF)-like protein